MKKSRINSSEGDDKMEHVAQEKLEGIIKELIELAKSKHGREYNLRTLKQYLIVNLDVSESELDNMSNAELIEKIISIEGQMPNVIVVNLPKQYNFNKNINPKNDQNIS